MRRLIIFFLCILPFAISVSAIDENDNNFVNLLDYTTFDSDGDNFLHLSSGDNVYYIDTVGISYSRYVDMLVITDCPDFSVSVSTNNAAPSNLIVEHISTNFYRIYGTKTFQPGSRLKFTINAPSSGYMEVLQLRYSSELTNSWPIEAYLQINTADYENTIHYVPTDAINGRSWDSEATYEDSFYQLYFWVEDWKKYDYIDVQLFLDVASIQSVSGMLGNDNIDLEVSYIGTDQWDSNMYYVSIGIDCTQFRRTIDDYPMVVIQGNVKFQSLNSVSVFNVSGRIFRSQTNVVSYWISTLNNNLDAKFASLNSWLSTNTSNILNSISNLNTHIDANFTSLGVWISQQTLSFENAISSVNDIIDSKFNALDVWILDQTSSIVRAINGDSLPGQQFTQEVNERNDELEVMAGVMDSVPKPDLSGVNFTPNIDMTAMQPLTIQLNQLMSESVFSSIFLLCFILAIASYILYGKR